MELLQAIESRTSVRAFTSEKVDHDILEKIVQTGNAAPISRFAKLHFSVVEDTYLINKLNAATSHIVDDMGLSDHAPKLYSYGAPVLVIISAKGENAYDQNAADSASNVASAAAAAQNICLASVAQGLASCLTVSLMLGVRDDNSQILKEELQVPEHYTPVLGVLIGHTAEPEPINRHRDSANISFASTHKEHEF